MNSQYAPPSAPPPVNNQIHAHFNSLNYPNNPQPVHYWLNLEVKNPWNARMSQRTTLDFQKLSSEMNEEVSIFFNLGNQAKFNLVYAQRSRWSSKRILLLFAVRSIVNFDPENMKKIVKAKIKNEGKLKDVKVYLRNLKIKTALESEYQHLMKYGANMCQTCSDIMKTHRNIDPSCPSKSRDILILLNVLQTLGLATTVTLLLLI